MSLFGKDLLRIKVKIMKKDILNACALLIITGGASAQNVGISEAAPNSKLDVVQTETTGSSIEVTHGITTNGSSAVWIKNSGTNRAFHAQNLSATSNSVVGRFLQMGNGAAANGLLIDMNNTTIVGTSGLLINQAGLGYGAYTLMPAGNASAGAVIDHLGSGDGLQIFQGGTGDGIYNDVTGGLGILNVIRSNNFGTVNLLTNAGGTGSYVDLDIQNGTGYYVLGVDNAATPTAGGDVYGFIGSVRTATPTAAGTVYGAVLAGQQYGFGHGILLTHSGTQGRNAEFNITNTNNPDPAIFAAHSGPGSVIIGQNQDNTIAGTISVADFSYAGTDVDDHIGVEGSSAPAAGWGIGVMGTGNWYGVFSQGNLGATGAKTFVIDHPMDPENKMLKHFSIESNEVLNLYRGTVLLDASGQATVTLPSYFEEINKDFSYQLTAIGTPTQPYVLTEIANNEFKVAGAPNTKVSWTVYADRNDKYMQEHPENAVDVLVKKGERAGKYFNPEFYDQPESKGMFYHQNNVNRQSSDFEIQGHSQQQIDELRNFKEAITPQVSQGSTE